LAELASGVMGRGSEVTILTIHERPGYRDRLIEAGAEVLPIAPRRASRLGRMRECARLLERVKPDLVHTTLFEADLTGRTAGKLCRVPVLSSLVSESYGPSHSADPTLSNWKLQAARYADVLTARFTWGIHAVSTRVADVMARRLHYPRDRITVIPRGRDPVALGRASVQRRLEKRQELSVAPADRMILTVAREEYPKGLDVLVRAAAITRERDPAVKFFIAGGPGSASDSIVGLVDTYGLGDTMTRLGPRSDVADLMCAADVVVCPSRREGFPGVLVEALALEATIVASDIPQIREVVGPDCAILAASEDARAFAEAILTGLSDERRQPRLLGRERFERYFTLDRMVDAMMDLYGRALR
jgi:glycosyltransferase involved in cell wall biosynthesis